MTAEQENPVSFFRLKTSNLCKALDYVQWLYGRLYSSDSTILNIAEALIKSAQSIALMWQKAG